MANQTNMEEILTSIRTTLAEETAKAATPNNTAAAEMSDEEVLALSEEDVAPATVPAADEVVDLAAFGQQGEIKMQASASVTTEIDILGEGEAETPAPAAAAPAAAPAPAAETPVTDAPAAPPAPAGDDLDKILQEMKSAPAPAPAPAAAPAPTAVPEPAADAVSLGLVGDVADLQVALPAEVLAAALRPMVQTWLEQNLSSVVERLVQAEISKISSGE